MFTEPKDVKLRGYILKRESAHKCCIKQEIMEIQKEWACFFTINELADHFVVNPKTIYRKLSAKGNPGL